MTLALVVASCSTTQSAGKQIDDTTIHAALTAKLTADRFSNIVHIDINVTNGVVTLAGGSSQRASRGRGAARSAHRRRRDPGHQ